MLGPLFICRPVEIGNIFGLLEEDSRVFWSDPTFHNDIHHIE
jgi:hypothetical protein